MILHNIVGLLHLQKNKVKTKVAISIGIISLVATILISINYYDTVFAFPPHCDKEGFPSCYSIGFDAGKENPGASCPSGHSKNFCNGWNDGANTDTSSHFDMRDFKIKDFGVENNNPFVVVQGKAGGTRGDESGDNEYGYIFDTDKGLFGAFSAFPNQPYTSSHFTQKLVNGHVCLDKAQQVGHVVISGHKLTITGIDINRVNRALTELSFVDSDNGNCMNTIYSSKP
jgi:hypothetical protein